MGESIQGQWEEWGDVTTQQRRREIIGKMSSLLEASAGKVRSNLRQFQRRR